MTVEPIEPPEPGTEDWGDDLNAYLAHLETRIVDLESRPDYIFNSYPWSFNGGAPPATASGQLRLDNSDPSQATMIDVRKIDFDGADRSPAMQLLNVGSSIRIGDWDNAAVLHWFLVAGPATFNATNAQIPVTWKSGSGALPTSGQAKINVGFVVALGVS